MQRSQGTDGLETLRWLARHQGYRAALDHALTASQTPGSRLHTDAWQWVIGPDAGLFRACREAIILGREALFTEWASTLDALIPVLLQPYEVRARWADGAIVIGKR